MSAQEQDIMEVESSQASEAGSQQDTPPVPPPSLGTTAEQRAKIVLFEQWANVAVVRPPFRRVIKSPNDLSALEVRECIRIFDACMDAHGCRNNAPPHMFEVFLAKVFDGWSSVPEVLPVNPLVYPTLQGNIVASGQQAVAHDANREGVEFVMSAVMDPQNKSCIFSLSDKYGRPVNANDVEVVQWQDRDTINHQVKMTVRKLIRQVDECFQKYNKGRAIQIARHFVACSARGLNLAQQQEPEYRFATTMYYLLMKYPLLWAAGSDQLEMPQMWR